MDVRSNAAHGRRAASAFLSRLLNFGLLAVLGVAGLVWSNQAQAQSCDFLAVGASDAAGPVNSQVNFQIVAATACNTTVDILISIDAGDTTGGATIAANGLTTFSTTINLDVPFAFGIVLGPNGGGDGSVTVTCVAGCFSNPPVTYTFQTNNLFNYTAIGGITTVVANQITPFTVGTNILLNGAPAALNTGFFNSTTLTNYGSVAPDGAGDASTTQSIFTAGSYIVTGNIICPTAFFLEGCPPPTVNFNVEIEPVAVSAVTPLNPSVVAGTPLAMTVAYGSPSIPATDGTAMNWSVTAQPAGGDGSVTGANVVGGESDATFNATVPGTYTVTANSGCTFCAPGLLSFNVTVTGTPTLAISGGDGQTTLINTPYALPLEVVAQNGGLPAGGVTIDWLVTGGAAIINPSGPTDFTGGAASATVTPTVGGPISIIASRADAPGVEVTFNLVSTMPPSTLTAVSANPATGTVGVAQDFTVRLEQGGTPLVGATIDWSATAPFSPSTSSSLTDAAGETTVSFTPASAGSFTGAVTALYNPDGIVGNADDVTLFFDATVAAVPTLAITSGDGQTSPVGTAFALPLVVTAEDSGVPAGGINIGWVVTSGNATLVASGPTAAADGQASATITPTGAGPVVVTATRSDAPAATVTFNLTATALPYTLTAVSANPASGTVGVATAFTVRLDQGGTPVSAANLQWTATAPFAPANFAGTTDAAGESTASFTPSAAGSFAGAVTALYDPDGVPANGDEISFAFDVGVASVPTLVINGGNGQTTPVGSNFPAVLSVIAEDSGVPAVGLTINWLVTGGTANVTPSGPTDAVGEAHLSVTPTSAGPITITATRSDAPAATVTFNLTATALPYTLTAVSANPASGTVGAATAFTVRLDQGGTPVSAANLQWTATAPFAPASFAGTTDAAGESTASFTPSAAGSFAGVVTALYDPDGVPANGDEITFAFDANVAAVPTLAISSGSGQSATVGTPLGAPLVVLAENSGVAAVGVNITWAVTGGTATVVPGGGTDAAGLASATVTPTSVGPITITATRADAPTETVTFNVTGNALPFSLGAISANPANGTVGVPLPLTVRLLQGGSPVAGASIQWSAGAPFAPATSAGSTNAAGDASASFTPSAFGSFAGAITATYDPDGVPANGDELSVSFDADIAFVASLAVTGGNGQNALVGAGFALPLQVNAQNSGTAAAGVTINWTVTGDATLVASGATDGAGDASATVTAGATPGAVTITASRQDDPAATVTFNLAVDALGTLFIVSGEQQTLQAGVPSAPLEVELKNAAGVPVAGAVISWSTTAGTLANATSTTGADGVASNTVTVAVPGAVEVTASSPLASAPAVFSLKGALSNLGGLTPAQVEVARAIDNLCPALAALPTRTPAQQDLLARCLELTDAAGIDPAAAIDALDQLLADVALTQSNAAFSAVQAQFQNLKARIAALRSGTNGTSFGGLALNTPSGPVSLGTLAQAFTANADGEGTEVGADFSRWGFFASGTIGRGEADAGSVDPAYDYDINGLTLGVDYRKNDKWILGGSVGYTRQDTDLPDGRGGLETSGWSLSAYTTYYRQDSWYGDAVLTWGRNDYQMLRRISYTVPTPGGGSSTIEQNALADATGDMLSTAFTFGRDFNRGAWGIGPYGRLLYTRLGFDAINERLDASQPGNGLGLRIEERDVTSLATVIGTKFTYTHSTDWGVLMPHLQLEWEHEFKDDPQAIEARFLNDPTGTAMVLRGDPLDTDYFRLGLGMSMVLTRGRSGFFYYEQLLGRNGMSQWHLALGLRMEF